MTAQLASATAHRELRDKSHRGNASQFFVAGELCRRGYVALITLGNTPNTDILCSDKDASRFVHIQVKTFPPGKKKTCSVGQKAERDFGPTFFWVIAGIPDPTASRPFEYYIVPSKDMAANVAEYHRRWLDTPGLKGQSHNDNKIRAVGVAVGSPSCHWSIAAYRDRWSLLDDAMRGCSG